MNRFVSLILFLILVLGGGLVLGGLTVPGGGGREPMPFFRSVSSLELYRLL